MTLLDPDDPVCHDGWEVGGQVVGHGLRVVAAALPALGDVAATDANQTLDVIDDGPEAVGDAVDEAVDEIGDVLGDGDACANSFAADTPVLMADGTHKAISDVRVGDKVLATDPAAGKSHSRTVTATMVHDDDDLLDVTIRDAAGHEGALQTTDHHKIWDVTRGAWVRAADLTLGDQLRQPDGTIASVVALSHRSGTQQMHDLTVQGDHSFYALTAGAGELVHNAVCPWQLKTDPNTHNKVLGGSLPAGDRLNDISEEDLQQLEDDLRVSIPNRMTNLWDPQFDDDSYIQHLKHAQRINQEQDLLISVMKRLGH
ncbi:polymorphic toxin-type HINT domain-containing protein [Aquihabitans sp. McL0605]|uniref:polymorphic toxin-type HINT domain-containing protein n=1 Tax=Aquihabitans sp. McL0605 TaxID=3415671 RepID=UPI003CF19761